MLNTTPKELTAFVDVCVTEALNEWLEACSTEDIAVMICVARARSKCAETGVPLGKSSLPAVQT